MKPPFDRWDIADAERLLGDAMGRHRDRALAEARAIDAAVVGNIVPPVNRHGPPWHQKYGDAFPSWDAFIAAVRSHEDPGAVEFAIRLLSRVAPGEVLPLARMILTVSPWKEMGSAVGAALGRVDDPEAVELAIAYAAVPYAMGGVSSSVCVRAWPVVLDRLKLSPVMDTSRTHPRGETYFVESLIAYFGNHRIEEAWPILSRLYAESVDEYVLLSTGHTLVAWDDERSLALLRKDTGSRREHRRFFAVRAHLRDGESRAMDALGGLEALRRDSGRALAHELMSQVWQRARDSRKATGGRGGIEDERYLDLALAWVKDKRMLGICRYVLDCWDKAQVAAAKKRLLRTGAIEKPAPAPKLDEANVKAMRASIKNARKNLARIVRELDKLGYAFDSKTPLGKPAPLKTVRAIEKAVGGPLPVSLRTAFLEIGSCDLTGAFPGHERSLQTDAFVFGDAKAILDEALENAGGEARWPLAFAPDAVGKAGFSGGQETILVPDASLDARVAGVKGEPYLLDRLRQTFRHGGFPGLAGKKGELGAIVARLAKVCKPI